MSDSLLSLDDITFSYDDGSSIISRLSLSIGCGQSIVLLGANGCGKSTLLKLLAGLLFPTSGRYLAWSREISESDLLNDAFGIFFRKNVGLLFQNSEVQLFNDSVFEEIAFTLRQLQESDESIHNRVDQLLERLNIKHLENRSPFALSGGEKKKVALASILAVNPEVILLDEPTAMLDPKSARIVTDIIIESKEARKTIITATHDLHIVSEVADKVVVLSETGQIMATGAPKEVLDNQGVLRAANLLHIHRHRHENQWHEHEHIHDYSHSHDHS